MHRFDSNLAMSRNRDSLRKTPISGAKTGEIMESAYSARSFEETLRLCQEVAKTFQGSEETLKHIQRIEKCLRKLVDETR